MDDFSKPLEIHRAAMVVYVPLEAGHDQFFFFQARQLFGKKPGGHVIDLDIVPLVGCRAIFGFGNSAFGNQFRAVLVVANSLDEGALDLKLAAWRFEAAHRLAVDHDADADTGGSCNHQGRASWACAIERDTYRPQAMAFGQKALRTE